MCLFSLVYFLKFYVHQVSCSVASHPGWRWRRGGSQNRVEFTRWEGVSLVSPGITTPVWKTHFSFLCLFFLFFTQREELVKSFRSIQNVSSLLVNIIFTGSQALLFPVCVCLCITFQSLVLFTLAGVPCCFYILNRVVVLRAWQKKHWATLIKMWSIQTLDRINLSFTAICQSWFGR